jgi:hypothetical protein
MKGRNGSSEINKSSEIIQDYAALSQCVRKLITIVSDSVGKLPALRVSRDRVLEFAVVLLVILVAALLRFS